VVAGLDVVVPLADLNAARGDAGIAELRDELIPDAGLARFRTATGPHGGKARAEIGDAGDAFPFVAVPAEGTRDFLAAFETDHGRNGFDVEAERLLERGVVAGAHHFREARIVLGQHDRVELRCKLTDDRLDPGAGLAFALGD